MCSTPTAPSRDSTIGRLEKPHRRTLHRRDSGRTPADWTSADPGDTMPFVLIAAITTPTNVEVVVEFGIFLNGYIPGPAAHNPSTEHTMLMREAEYTIF